MPPMKKQHGFSMIEVLVAVVVLVFGVLGMAGLQMQAITATEQGRYNSRAAMQATSVAAAIRANPLYWTSANGTITVSGPVVANVPTFSGGPTAFTGDCTNGTMCTPVQMAYYDLKNWGLDINGSLPVGVLTVTCDSVTQKPAVCTVDVSWSEKNVAGRDQETGSGALATGTSSRHNYRTLVTALQKKLTL